MSDLAFTILSSFSLVLAGIMALYLIYLNDRDIFGGHNGR